MNTLNLRQLYRLHQTGEWLPLETDGLVIANPRVMMGNVVTCCAYLGYLEMKRERLDPLESIFFSKWGKRDSTDNLYYLFHSDQITQTRIRDLALSHYNLCYPVPELFSKWVGLIETIDQIPRVADQIDDMMTVLNVKEMTVDGN